MERRRWLIVAVLLLAAAAVLMSRGDAPRKEPAHRVEFPRQMRPQEWERSRQRRTLPAENAKVQPVFVPPGLPGSPEQDLRDPLLVALPAPEGSTALVFEANALRHSPVGELLLDCLLREGSGELEEVRRELGFDPVEGIDRIAVSDEVLLVSGHFAGANWDRLAEGSAFEPYGDKGRLVRGAGSSLGVWGDELIVLGDDPAEVEAVFDRLEGRAQARPFLEEDQTYGEIYGRIDPRDLASLLPAGEAALRQRFLEAARSIELHVDASHDVAIVADVAGESADRVADLGKSLGAALALARLQAQTQRQDDLAELLDLARVVPFADRFSLELALPLPFLQRHLEDACPRRPAKEREAEAPPATIDG